jgi:glutathione S-transferase
VGDWKITETVPDGGILLCGHPVSGNVIPIMCFCTKFLKDKFKFQFCDVLKGEQMSAEFLDLNPFHQMPAAKMSDGTKLFESGAMLRYLALKYAPELYPADKQLVIDMALDKRSTDFMKEWKKFALYVFGLAPPPEKDAAKGMNSILGKMEKAFLKDTKYVGSDKLTIADISLATLINSLSYPIIKKMGYTLPDRWTKYLADTKNELGASFSLSVSKQEEMCNGRLDQVTAIDFES